MIDILAPAGPYRAAVAELPLSARLIDAAANAIVVVPGGGRWVDVVREAAETGALAVVVADPELVPAADVRDLAERTRIPVIVERPLLRMDVAADARATHGGGERWAAPHALVLEGGASEARLGVVARDAVGWARVLTGSAPTLLAADRGLAVMDGAGVPVSVSVVTTRRPGGGWIRAQALGVVVTDVEIEGRVFRVSSSSAAGRLILPTRFESSERLALRRALSAVAAGDVSGDLAELAADTALAESILA